MKKPLMLTLAAFAASVLATPATAGPLDRGPAVRDLEATHLPERTRPAVDRAALRVGERLAVRVLATDSLDGCTSSCMQYVQIAKLGTYVIARNADGSIGMITPAAADFRGFEGAAEMAQDGARLSGYVRSLSAGDGPVQACSEGCALIFDMGSYGSLTGFFSGGSALLVSPAAPTTMLAAASPGDETRPKVTTTAGRQEMNNPWSGFSPCQGATHSNCVQASVERRNGVVVKRIWVYYNAAGDIIGWYIVEEDGSESCSGVGCSSQAH